MLHLTVLEMIEACTSKDAMDDVTAPFTSPHEEPINPDRQSLIEAMDRDPVGQARDFVNVIRASQLRRHEFLELIRIGNRRKKWMMKRNGILKVIELKELIPPRDVSTRWESLYRMVNTVLYLREVCHFSFDVVISAPDYTTKNPSLSHCI